MRSWSSIGWLNRLLSSNKKELIPYFAVSGGLLIYGFLFYYITLEIFHLPIYPTYIVGFFSGTILSYLLNGRYTFKTGDRKSFKQFFEYLLTYFLGLSLGLFLIYMIKKITSNFQDFVIVYIVLVPRALLTYLILKKWVFRKNKEEIT